MRWTPSADGRTTTTIKVGPVTVTVTRPTLTEKERATREAQVLTAAGQLLRTT